MTDTNGQEGLGSLLERVRAATGPDRGLDGLIARDVEGWTPHFALEGDDLLDWPSMGGHWHLPGDAEAEDCQSASSDEPPAYTTSIDAALALVERMLPGWASYVSAHDGECFSGIWLEDPEDNTNPLAAEEATGRTRPLAILTAMLAALASQRGEAQ